MILKRANVIEQVALMNSTSPEEVRKEMEETIKKARNSPNPEVQAIFRNLFGEKAPTPEEFIYTVANNIKQNNYKEYLLF